MAQQIGQSRRASNTLGGGSDDGALRPAGVGREAKNFDDGLLMRLGPGGLPDMHASAIAAPQRGGDALLRAERFTQRVPCVIDAFGLELQTQGMHKVVGQYADEQMPLHLLDPALHPRVVNIR